MNNVGEWVVGVECKLGRANLDGEIRPKGDVYTWHTGMSGMD